MPDSLDSVSTASEEGGSYTTEETSLYTPSPNSAILDHHHHHHDLDSDSDSITTMSCLTTTRRKSARDLNNRWVLLNKDTFQEILNATLNQMTTGVEPGDNNDPARGEDGQEAGGGQALDYSTAHSPTGPKKSPSLCGHDVGEPSGGSSTSNKKTGTRTPASPRQVSHSKGSDKPGNISGASRKTGVSSAAGGGGGGGGRKPMASAPNRTIIASSAFKKHELRVVSRINFKDAVDRAQRVSKLNASGPQPRNAAAATATATTGTTTAAAAAATTPAPRKHSSSKRSKAVSKAQNKTAPGDLTGSRSGQADTVRRGGSSSSSGAHGSAQAAASITEPTVHRPSHTPKDSKVVQQSSTAAQADNMSVAAVAASPPPAGTSSTAVPDHTNTPSTSDTRSAGSISNTTTAAMKSSVPERWVKVSKSTLFDLVEELVARRLGEDSPATADANTDDTKTRQSDSVSDNKDNVNLAATSTKSANSPAKLEDCSTRKDTDNKGPNHNNNDRSGTKHSSVSKEISEHEHNDSNDNTKSGSVGWVALNKNVVIDMVDEAIMRQLDDDNDSPPSAGDEYGSDSGSQGNLEPADSNRRRSSERTGQVDAVCTGAAARDGSRPAATATATTLCPQGGASDSPPTHTRPTQSPKPIPETSRLESELSIPGQQQQQQQQHSKSKKRVLECIEEESAEKRRKSDSGLCSGSSSSSVSAAAAAAAAAAVASTASTSVQKGFSLASARDSMLTAAILSSHGQSITTGNVALRNVFAPSDPSLGFASSCRSAAPVCSPGKATTSRSGLQSRVAEFGSSSNADKNPLASRECNIIDQRVKTLPGEGSVAAISHFPARTLANQSAPTDSPNNDAVSIKLDGRALDLKSRNNTDRANVSPEAVTSNKRDTKNARDSPETTWVAVSKSEVNNIVECVVNTMINDDETVTSPARADDSSTRSVTPRSTSGSERDDADHDVGDGDAAAENVPPPVVSAQILANRQVGSDSGSDRDSPQSKTMTLSGQRHQSLTSDKWCSRTENLPNKPPLRSASPSSHVKENAFDSPFDKLEDGEELAEDCDGEEPKKAFKWKSTLMKRVREENGSKTGGRGSPALPGRGRSQSDPGLKTVVKDKQDRRCSKRVSNTSGKRRQHRPVLTAT